MKTTGNLAVAIKNQNGVAALITGIAMLMLLSFAALAVDVGFIMTNRNELQNIADAAALASARQLGEIYLNPPYNAGIHAPLLVAAARNVAQSHIDDGNQFNIEIGTWVGNAFASPAIVPNATKITVRKDHTTFFAKLFGKDEFSVQATAIAALTTHPDFIPGVHANRAIAGRGNGIDLQQPGGMGTIPSLVK